MGLTDCLFMALLSAAVCISLPKLLSMMQQNQVNGTGADAAKLSAKIAP
jgi:hypothetical protein